MEREFGFAEAHPAEIQRPQRLGKRIGAKPRPILVRFLRSKDCEKIFNLGSRLRDTGYQMFRDLPQELVKRRRSQMDTVKKAREHNLRAAFSKAEPDKLYIGGKLWPVGKPFRIPND